MVLDRDREATCAWGQMEHGRGCGLAAPTHHDEGGPSCPLGSVKIRVGHTHFRVDMVRVGGYEAMDPSPLTEVPATPGRFGMR